MVPLGGTATPGFQAGNGLIIITYSGCGDGNTGAGEACDLGVLNGTAGVCCTVACQHRPAGETCRASVGECDVAEACTGSSATCPSDAMAAPGASCGSTVNEDCTDPDTCDGLGGCSANHATVGLACADDGNPCTTDLCDGAGHCENTPGNAGATCRAAEDACDVVETCSGSSVTCPSDSKAPSGTSCGSAVDDACTDPDTCDGAGSCLPNHAGAGSPCPGDENLCTTDLCDGTGQCVVAPGNGGAVCRPAAGDCDVPEACTGTSVTCPADVLVGAGTTCRASTGTCDVAEACTGADPTCPADSGPLSCAPCHQCDAILGCVPRARLDCTAPTASDLSMRNSLNDELDTFTWKWSGTSSSANLGEPRTTTTYTLCMFDQQGGVTSTAVDAVAPPAGLCRGRPCWKSTSTGFSYDGRGDNATGLTNLKVAVAASGKGRITVKGKGPGVDFPTALAVRPPVEVQLEASGTSPATNACWRAEFADPIRNDASQLKARYRQ